MPSFKLKSSWVTILHGVEFSILLLILAWALQKCSATALPVICYAETGVFNLAKNGEYGINSRPTIVCSVASTSIASTSTTSGDITVSIFLLYSVPLW